MTYIQFNFNLMDRCESGTELHRRATQHISQNVRQDLSKFIWLPFTTECHLRPDAFRDIDSRSRQPANKHFLRTANENQL